MAATLGTDILFPTFDRQGKGFSPNGYLGWLKCCLGQRHIVVHSVRFQERLRDPGIDGEVHVLRYIP